MNARYSRLMVGFLLLLDGYVLCRFVPNCAQLLRNLTAPHAWVARAGADGAIGTAAGVLLWLVALWLAIGLGATLIAVGTGCRHGLLATLSRRATPALLRRLVIASTGASIALSPVTALAVGSGAAAPIAGSIAIGIPSDQATPELAPPGWPLDQAVGRPSVTTSAGLPAGPTSVGRPTATSPTPAAGTTPQPPLAGTTPGPPLDPHPDRPAPSTVLVKPGDSLWLLTAQRLGPTATDDQIAVAWPYWYRQNRPVIGPDPNLLQPGQRLVVPMAEGTA